jgi:hypothetical protein
MARALSAPQNFCATLLLRRTEYIEPRPRRVFQRPAAWVARSKRGGMRNCGWFVLISPIARTGCNSSVQTAWKARVCCEIRVIFREKSRDSCACNFLVAYEIYGVSAGEGRDGALVRYLSWLINGLAGGVSRGTYSEQYLVSPPFSLLCATLPGAAMNTSVLAPESPSSGALRAPPSPARGEGRLSRGS